MTPDQVAAWAAAGESETQEFKKSTAEKECVCRTLCAFGNGRGGRALIGVTPGGKVVGQAVSDRTLEELAREFQSFEPPLFPTLERVPVAAGREVLVVTVARSPRVPVAYRGVAYERVLNTTTVMPRATWQRLLLEEMHAIERWENRPAEGWDIGRLDHREMVLTMEEAIRQGRSADPGTREPLEILRGLGLLVDGDRLSRAAVVLFCKDEIPRPDYPQLLLKVARFKGVDRNEFLDNRQYHGNAFALMRQAERFLIDWLPVAGRIVPGQMAREDTPLLPVEARREALANAFVHRDYSIGGGSVSVALYDDRLEIISTGELHFGLTPEALFREHESRPWNPMIAQTFYRRGIIEVWGRGTLKIARLMQEAGLAPPEVAVRTGAVVVTFVLPGEAIGRVTVKTPVEMTVETPKKATPGKTPVEMTVEMTVETPGKTPKETRDAIVRLLRAEPGLSVRELASRIGRSKRTIERAVVMLRESGRLEHIGPTKGGRWRVNA